MPVDAQRAQLPPGCTLKTAHLLAVFGRFRGGGHGCFFWEKMGKRIYKSNGWFFFGKREESMFFCKEQSFEAPSASCFWGKKWVFNEGSFADACGRWKLGKKNIKKVNRSRDVI